MIFNYKDILNKWENLTSLDCIYYCRVSSKEQEKGTSLDDQKEICETFCRGYNMNIIEGFSENVSAMKGGKRPKFNKWYKCSKTVKQKYLFVRRHQRID